MGQRELLLDTNAFVAMIQESMGVLASLPKVAQLNISLFTVGELQSGVSKSTRRDSNLRYLDRAMLLANVICPDLDTAYHYGQLHAQACAQGHFPPQNDLWIAAIAIQHRLPLVTRDKHFDRIAGLELLTW